MFYTQTATSSRLVVISRFPKVIFEKEYITDGLIFI